MQLDEQYQTGVLWQDFQHGQLIDLFEKLKETGENKDDKRLPRYSFGFLAMYVNHHFKLEEQYMKKYRYPDTAAHQKEHREFIKELKWFRNEKKEYSKEGSGILLARLSEWILNHILAVDRDFGNYILDYEKQHNR